MIVVLGFFLILAFGFTLVAPAISSVEQGIHPIGSLFSALAYIPIGISIFIFKMIFFLPNFKSTYRYLLIFGLFVAIDSVMITINVLTFRGSLEGEYIRDNTPPIGFISFALSMLLIGVVALIRLREIREMTREKEMTFFSPKFAVSLSINMAAAAILFVVISIDPTIPIPQYLVVIPLCIILVTFTYGIISNENLFFVVPIKYIGVVIMDQHSGIVLFGDGFEDEGSVRSLLAGFFTALNISLQDAIQSDSPLEEISLGDRVVHITPGSDITSLFITSKRTIMTSYISRYLSRSFERKFDRKIIDEATHGIISGEFLSFNTEIEQIKELMILQG